MLVFFIRAGHSKTFSKIKKKTTRTFMRFSVKIHVIYFFLEKNKFLLAGKGGQKFVNAI